MSVGQTTTGPLPLFYGRVGLGERVDLGGKYFFPLGGIGADVKYQLIDRQLKMAADLGGSIFFTGPNAVHSALLLGTEQIYAGPRFLIFPGTIPGGNDEYGIADTDFSRTMGGAVIGAALGPEDFRVMPEVSFYLSQDADQPIIVPGLGLNFRIGVQ